MVVGTLCLQLRLDGCFSLKDKRQVLRSVMDRTRREYQVAIAEIDDMDLWNRATLGVACVTNDPIHAESVLQHVLDAFDARPDLAVEDAAKDVERR